MSGLVIDASFTLATLFDDERTPTVLAARARVTAEGALVPGLWWLEVANSLLVAERRKRVTRDRREGSLADPAALPIATDPETAPRAWSDTLALAEAHGPTVYDAAYLELALRRQLPLATLDRELVAAAGACGVAIV